MSKNKRFKKSIFSERDKEIKRVQREKVKFKQSMENFFKRIKEANTELIAKHEGETK